MPMKVNEICVVLIKPHPVPFFRALEAYIFEALRKIIAGFFEPFVQYAFLNSFHCTYLCT
jgi:hypothetical protein